MRDVLGLEVAHGGARIRSTSRARGRSSPAAARGSGLAIARGLGRAGSRVVLNGRNRDKLAKRGGSAGGRRHRRERRAVRCDRRRRRRRRIADVERALGPIDILVNNAAMNQRKPLEEFTPDEWRTLMAANLDGPFLVTRALLPAMKARRRGKIINVCSLAADLGRPNIVPYAASKGALRMLTRALAVELAPSNIQVNGISPGFFKTEMNAPLIADAGVLGLGRAAHAGRTMGRAPRDRRRRGVSRVTPRRTM